jgi:hypothetical protein
MKNAEGPVEKRNHNRFQAKDGVYAIINSGVGEFLEMPDCP